MLVIGINWQGGWVQIIADKTYTCPMEERDDDFYFRFKNQWHPVSQYASERLEAEIKSHRLNQQRESISQAEFEMICEEVISKHPNISRYWFEVPGIVHISYPSHSGKSTNGATLYFGEKGYITHRNWMHRAGSNEGIFIGEEIARKIHSAMFD